MNITLALTVHTRAPLDLGLVSVGKKDCMEYNFQFCVNFPNIMSGENHIARIATPVSSVDKQVKIISVFHLSPNIFMLNPIIY